MADAQVREGNQNAVRSWQRSGSRKGLVWFGVLLACLTLLSPAVAQDTVNRPLSLDVPAGLAGGPEQWTSPDGLSATLQVMLMLTVLSLAPAVLMMTTCFVRIIVVLGLLRQALGTQSLPPSQVITTLALFITLLVMSPVWKEVYETAIRPYTNHEISMEEAWENRPDSSPPFYEHADRQGGERERCLSVPEPHAGSARGGRLRGRAADRTAARLHGQ